jgi:hypothetical protein
MESLSKIVNKIRLPLKIELYPYLLDHRFEGKAVLPAVEAMQVLAASTQNHLPKTDLRYMQKARFDKFFYIEPDNTPNTRPSTKIMEAFNEITVNETDDICVKLITKTKFIKAGITRVKEHAAMQFSQRKQNIKLPPLDTVSDQIRKGFHIAPDKLYRDLVPFGPAYHNIKDNLFVSKEGAFAEIKAPKQIIRNSSQKPLGSPFPLDAAFHAACVWGQRYRSIVGFPVGFAKRMIVQPTRPGKKYICLILPASVTTDLLVFDLWLYDLNSVVFEAVLGLQMKDVSAGRMKPPMWVIQESTTSSSL